VLFLKPVFHFQYKSMRQLISRVIVGIFKVLVPLFYISFILSGLACALVTSVIAYQTVKGLFPKDATVWIFSIPLLIVISFEVSKVFIIFLNKQYSDSKNDKYLIDKSLFLFLRGLLITISGIFTLLFTFYNLDNPELDTKFEQEKITINQSFEKQENNLNKNYDNQKLVISQNYDNQIKPYTDEMVLQRQYKYSNGEYMGPRWNEANTKYGELNDQRNTALLQNENDRTKAQNDIETLRLGKIKDAEKNLKSDNASSNKMINAMLEVITFNPSYNKGYYIFAIFIFSILISFGLEFVIWSSFTVLAINHGDFFEFDLEMKTINEQHAEAVDVMNTMTDRNIQSRLQNIINLKNKLFKRTKKVVDESIDEVKNI